MRITKKQIAELCAFSYEAGYKEAQAVLKDGEMLANKEIIVEMMIQQLFKEKPDGSKQKES